MLSLFQGPQLFLPWMGWGPLPPLRVDVSLTPSDEVQQLRQQVSDITLRLSELETQFNRTEYLYRCETIINLRLQDFCREHGLKVPRQLLGRPFDVSG